MVKPGKLTWILLFSGILLLLAGTVFGGSVYRKVLDVNGAFSMQKVMVSMKKPLEIQGENNLSLDDMKTLAKYLKTNDLTYTGQSGLVSSVVSGNQSSYTVKIIGTNYLYPMFNKVVLEYGCFITREIEEEGGCAAIIEEEVAWNLFKTKNAVGQTVLVYNVPFRVIGIIKKDHSIIENLTDSGTAKVFISAGKMLELDNTAKITSFQVKTGDTSTLDQNTALICNALLQINKSPTQYCMEDYNLKRVLMEQKPKMIIFMTGIFSILLLFIYMKNVIKEVLHLVKEGCKTDYFVNVMKGNMPIIGISMMKVLLFIGGMVLIWAGIKFKVYVPPKYIPDELINISYYHDLFKSYIQTSISGIGNFASETEILTNTVEAISNWIFYLALIPGCILLSIGFMQLKLFDIEVSLMILHFGSLTIASLAILIVVACITGLPFVMEMKSAMVLWSFLTIVAIRSSEQISIKV